MKSSAAAPDIPVTYLRHLLKLGTSWGISEQRLLADIRLSPTQLNSPNTRIHIKIVGKIARRLASLSQRDDLGMAYGLLTRPTILGALGYAIISCATLGDAMRVIDKYLGLSLSDLSVKTHADAHHVTLTLSENYNFATLRQTYIEAFLVMSCSTIKYLVGDATLALMVKVDWPKPAYFDDYADLLPPWQFNAPSPQLLIAKTMLPLPLIMADSDAAQHALTLIDKEMAARAITAANFAARVRQVLDDSPPPGYPDLSAIASQLCVSERTLKRRLSESGDRFQHLLDEVRLRHAIALINAKQLSLSDIARQLGYTDPAAFTRAFKRWTGERPSQWQPKSL